MIQAHARARGQKVLKLKLTCRVCHNVGYLEFTKKDLKNLRAFLQSEPTGTKFKDWTIVRISPP